MAEIVFNLPDEKTPGYLRRVLAANRFNELMKAGELTSSAYEDLITFLLGFISEPEDRGEAREALLDASLEQYRDLLGLINKPPNPTSPEPTEKS
jgi:hypothetical protein